MADVFFFGPLSHPPLLETVLGRAVELCAATLFDHSIYWTEGQGLAGLVTTPGINADGLLARGLTGDDLDCLGYYCGALGGIPQTVVVQADGPVAALAYSAGGQNRETGGPWQGADWVARWGAVTTATAQDMMALRGQRSAAEVGARYGAMMVRAASRLRAQGAPATLRHEARAGDVGTTAFRQPYAKFFSVEEYDVAWRRFDGTSSATVTRAVFLSGDAVTVLPYDPVRDRVLLIEQFRAGPYARGDDQPWLLEVIAGRIDAGETPQEAARREAVEEAGLVLGQLLKVADYYPTPGAKSEYLYSYVALVDLPDGTAGTFGLAEEAEDIRGHLISFDALMQLVTSGEAANAPLILTALWLQRERGRLRG